MTHKDLIHDGVERRISSHVLWIRIYGRLTLTVNNAYRCSGVIYTVQFVSIDCYYTIVLDVFDRTIPCGAMNWVFVRNVTVM